MGEKEIMWKVIVKQDCNTIEFEFKNADSEEVMIFADNILQHGVNVSVDIQRTNVKPEESEDK